MSDIDNRFLLNNRQEHVQKQNRCEQEQDELENQSIFCNWKCEHCSRVDPRARVQRCSLSMNQVFFFPFFSEKVLVISSARKNVDRLLSIRVGDPQVRTTENYCVVTCQSDESQLLPRNRAFGV